jgi:hypothetical protein
MPRPRVSEIDQAIRRYAGANGNGDEPALRRPRAGSAPASPPPRAAESGLELAGELDVEAIGRLAAYPPQGTTPDDLIERALHAAGVEGAWSSSREYRELWYLCVLAREAYLEGRSPVH